MPSPQRILELHETRMQADEARLRFFAELETTKARLSPGSLKQDVVSAVSQKAKDAREGARTALRNHPVLTTAAVAAIIALLFWKPVRLIGRYAIRGAWLFWLNRTLWR